MLRQPAPLVAHASPRGPEDRRISPRELRTFLGEPKQRQWLAILVKAGVRLRWRKPYGWPARHERCGLTKAQVMKVMRVRYESVGARRIQRWRLG